MTEPARRLEGRRIALGISGSIAAYKAVELLRLLQAEGADVRVLMTASATEFVGPLTLETLSGHPVDADVLALQADGRIGHISTAHDVEAIVVAPATAHWLGAMAHGLAADTITAACLATSVPVIVAPAMDGGMYAHPATRANVATLREFGYRFVDPESGVLASGMVGQGRLASLDRIVEATVAALGPAPAVASPAHAATVRPRTDLTGRHVVVTAGGTAEPIDPVRFVGNRSTGKMGVAVAQEALDRGAAVTLILGNHSVEPPAGAHVARVETANEMEAALRALTPPEGPRFDVLVMAAAVADFRPHSPSDRKVGRAAGMSLEMEATPDLLAATAERVRSSIRGSGARRPVLVGFAAETGSLDRAEEKLRSKGVDLLVANDVTEPGSGFGTDTNKVTMYSTDGSPEELPLMSKREVAELLLDRVVMRITAADRQNPAPEEANR
ncbi:MAG: bifunctional phosphopantothenoylcysteine decarboxylase/phosphopantothenate--cysteine ligase CoaBC [Candidatus Limnocylindrales bacterium]